MPKLDGQDITILRIAGDNDPGYDPRIPKAFIRTDQGERMVLRSDIDETDDIPEDQRAERAAAQGRSTNPTDMAVEERRREARRMGRPPDQTPAPFLTTATGRQVPNPDALETDGRSPVLEQAKQGQPTVPTGPGNQAISDRGDPRAGTMSADLGPDAQRESSQRAIEADADKQRERDEERKRKEAEEADKSGERDPNAAPPGTSEGLGEDQRKKEALEQGMPPQPAPPAPPPPEEHRHNPPPA